MIRLKTVRNSDYVEVTVRKGEEIILKGAYVYGFRNIQNLVMRMKVCLMIVDEGQRKKCVYDAVEVMACPKYE